MSRIRQKSEQAHSPTPCNTGVWKLKICLEIIYIILSNKLSNYGNIETVAQNLGDFGDCFSRNGFGRYDESYQRPLEMNF